MDTRILDMYAKHTPEQELGKALRDACIEYLDAGGGPGLKAIAPLCLLVNHKMAAEQCGSVEKLREEMDKMK